METDSPTLPVGLPETRGDKGERSGALAVGLPPTPESSVSGYTHCHCTQNQGHRWKEIDWALVADSTVLVLPGH